MRYQRVFIEAVTYELPTTVVTTASLETMLGPIYPRMGLSKGFLEAITGVRARRFWDRGTRPSQVATRAAERVLADNPHIPRERIQALVSTSVCKDYLEPSTAALVHGNLGLSTSCLNFDVGNACLGFMTGMVTVANMIELGQIDVGLVVAGEGSRGVTESTLKMLLQPGSGFDRFKDNLASLTLGSAATAMLLVSERYATAGHQLLGGQTLSATEYNHLCVGTEQGMTTDAAKLLQEGVDLAVRTWQTTRHELGLETEDFREFALHQVGKANHTNVVQKLGLPPDRALKIYPEVGNVGAAGVPTTLARAVEDRRVRPGDNVALMGIGSGINCQMMGVRW